jgi:hypothetical protein
VVPSPDKLAGHLSITQGVYLGCEVRDARVSRSRSNLWRRCSVAGSKLPRHKSRAALVWRFQLLTRRVHDDRNPPGNPQ